MVWLLLRTEAMLDGWMDVIPFIFLAYEAGVDTAGVSSW